MDALAQAESCGEVMSSWWRGSAAKKVLLMAGIAAVVVYTAGDVLSGLLYDGYSFRNQAISELSAFGSPVRPLMATVIVIHGALLLAFGIGILRVAEQRSLRWVGWLLVAGFFVVGLWNHTSWAMSARDLETGFNDTMHIALTGVFCRRQQQPHREPPAQEAAARLASPPSLQVERTVRPSGRADRLAAGVRHPTK